MRRFITLLLYIAMIVGGLAILLPSIEALPQIGFGRRIFGLGTIVGGFLALLGGFLIWWDFWRKQDDVPKS
jgi:hypothetical protein